MKESDTESVVMPIAIIGMSCRFPGARNVGEFWKNLCEGVESITFFSDQELIESGLSPETLPPGHVRAKGVIEDVENFDAALFSIHPREAEIMDPQHRVFLECAWEALEHAGYDPEKYPEAIGVYAGTGISSYLPYVLSNDEIVEALGRMQIGIGNDKDHLTTRVSYKLGLRGPSITVQTACSTSLVSVHLACQSLLNGECDMALAGGVSIIVPQKAGYIYQEGGVFSPDGHCRAFDADARGTVFSNGAGIVVLKRLEDALADRDNIHAIIKGSAINNDGSLKVGYTAPGLEGQSAVIAEAQEIAGVAPETIGYVETHGTGTPLGDPIEIAALTQAFRTHTSEKQFCAIGSVKTNIGHLDSAAGIAGLIKTTLAVKHNLIPASLHYKTANPEIDFKNSPFYVNDRLEKWKEGRKRRAGISSFGIGGTNAHVIIEEAGVVEESHSSRRVFILPISGNSPTAVELLTRNLSASLSSRSDISLPDVAFTLQMGRRELAYRRCVVAESMDEVLTTLSNPKEAIESESRVVYFLFPGQGSQFVNAGRQIYKIAPKFREVVDRCDEALRKITGERILSLLYPERGEEIEAGLLLRETRYTQLALFILEYALAEQLIEWGIKPGGMIGHSLGEIVAATVAGIFSEEDALKLVAVRAEAMSRQPRGTMLAVGMSEETVRNMIGDELSIAAINTRERCVISGAEEDIEKIQAKLNGQGVPTKKLETSHAFHSKMIEGAVKEVVDTVRKMSLSEAKIPIISNLTGRVIEKGENTRAEYWGKQMRGTVKFAQGAEELMKDEQAVFIEVGPGRDLIRMVEENGKRITGQKTIRTMRDRREKEEDEERILMESVGRLWESGQQVQWEKLNEGESLRRVEIPSYPFERKRYWVDTKRGAGLRNPIREKAKEGERFYVTGWRQEVRDETVARSGKEKWLVMGDKGIAEKISRILEKEGEVIKITTGEGYRKCSDREYEIAIKEESDYERLLEDLNREGWNPTKIVHLWTLGSIDGFQDRIDFSDHMQDRGFYSLLYLAKALGGSALNYTVRLDVVTDGLHCLGGEDNLYPEKATILGPCRVIPKEYPNIICRNIDIVLPAPGSLREERLIDHLVWELAYRSDEATVAYRGNQRWVQTFDPIQLNGLSDRPSALREGGVYLITGGLGGLGLILGDYLAQSSGVKLLLVGREGLPHRNEWAQWLTAHSEYDATSIKIRKVQQIEMRGAEVMIFNADVTDRQAMRDILSQADKKFGRINGVIHAAGVPGGGIIQLKTRDMAEKVLAAKVRGTLVLADLLKDTPLDFFVLCSSALALAAPAGQVDYCAANSFLDAFACAAADRPWKHTVSIDWDAWQNTGMVAKPFQENNANIATLHHSGRPVEHPLFDRVVTDSQEKAVFVTELTASSHWVLDQHKIMGDSVMPGTAYIEMARAAFHLHTGIEPVEIQDVIFITPMIVKGDESKEAHTIIEQGDEWFRFRIISRTIRNSLGGSDWQEHVSGRLAPLRSTDQKQFIIDDLIQVCNLRTVDASEREKRNSNFAFGPRWDALKKVFIGKDQMISSVELPDQFLAETEIFKLHPSLLDVATGAAIRTLSDIAYIPLSYRTIRIKAALSGQVYSYIKFDESALSHRDTVSFDCILLDKYGTELIEIEGFILKRIDNMAANRPSLSESAQARGQSNAPGHVAPTGLNGARNNGHKQNQIRNAISPAGGVDAFSRIMARADLTQIVVSARDIRDLSEITVYSDQPSSKRNGDNAASFHPRPDLKTEYIAPGSEIEERLAEIWKRLLGVERIGIDDNFFELGGHSLLALQVMSRVRESFNVDIPINDLFETPTIGELAKSIEHSIMEKIMAKIDTISEEEAQVLLEQNEGHSQQVRLYGKSE